MNTIQATVEMDNTSQDLTTFTAAAQDIQQMCNNNHLTDDVPRTSSPLVSSASQLSYYPKENANNKCQTPDGCEKSLTKTGQESEELYSCSRDLDHADENLEMSLKAKNILLEKTELELLLEQTKQIQQQAAMLLSQKDNQPNDAEQNGQSLPRGSNARSDAVENIPTASSHENYIQSCEHTDLTEHQMGECPSVGQNGWKGSPAGSDAVDRSPFSYGETTNASQKWRDNIQLLEENAEMIQKKLQLEILLQQAKLLLEKSQLLPVEFPADAAEVPNETESPAEPSGLYLHDQDLTSGELELAATRSNYGEKPAQEIDSSNSSLTGNLNSDGIQTIHEGKERSKTPELDNEKEQTCSMCILPQHEQPSEHNSTVNEEKINTVPNETELRESKPEKEMNTKNEGDTTLINESETDVEKLELQLLLEKAKVVLEKAKFPLKSKYIADRESVQKDDQSAATQTITEPSMERIAPEEIGREQCNVASDVALQKEINDSQLKFMMTKAKILQQKAQTLSLLGNRFESKADVDGETIKETEKRAEIPSDDNVADSAAETCFSSTFSEKLSSINRDAIKQIIAIYDDDCEAELPNNDERSQKSPEKEDEAEESDDNDEDDASFDYKLELQKLLQRTKSLLEKTTQLDFEGKLPTDPECIPSSEELSATHAGDSPSFLGTDFGILASASLNDLETLESTQSGQESTNKSVIEVNVETSQCKAGFNSDVKNLVSPSNDIEVSGKQTEKTSKKVENLTTITSSDPYKIDIFKDENELNQNVYFTVIDQNGHNNHSTANATGNAKQEVREIKQTEEKQISLEHVQKTNQESSLEQMEILNEKHDSLLLEKAKPLQQTSEEVFSGEKNTQEKISEQLSVLSQVAIDKSCPDNYLEKALHTENIKQVMSRSNEENSTFETKEILSEGTATMEDQDRDLDDDFTEEIEAPLEIEESLSDTSELSDMIHYYDATDSEAEEDSSCDKTEEAFDEKNKLQQLLQQAQILLERTNQPINKEISSNGDVSATESQESAKSFEKRQLNTNMPSVEREIQSSQINETEMPSQLAKSASEVEPSQAEASAKEHLILQSTSDTLKQSTEIQNTFDTNCSQLPRQILPLSEMSQQLLLIKAEVTSFLGENAFRELKPSSATSSNDDFVRVENQTKLQNDLPVEVESEQSDLSDWMVIDQHSIGDGSQRLSAKSGILTESLPDDTTEELKATKPEPCNEGERKPMSQPTNLTMLLKLQTEMAKMQLQMSNLQDAMRAANFVLQELVEDAFSTM